MLQIISTGIISLTLVLTFFNHLKLRKMNDVFQSFEQFLQSIGASMSAVQSSLAQIAQGLNPSGLTADEVTKLTGDLTALSGQASTLAASAQAAATAAAAGAPAPGAPGVSGSTGNNGSTN